MNSGCVEYFFVIILVLIFIVINGVDGFCFGILVHEVDLWPVSLSLSISARFVFLDSFPAFLLSMPLLFAKVAIFVVPVRVVSASAAWASSFIESRPCLIASSSGCVSTSILVARLVCLGLSPSAIEGGYIIFVIHGLNGDVLLADFVYSRWKFCFSFPLGSGGHHVHLFDRHGFWILLSYHSL